MVLGLNIGVLIGIIASYGITGIIGGGILSGIIVGTIGSLAIFGPTVALAIGAFAGGVVGLFISALMKVSIRSSMGEELEYTFTNIFKCREGRDYENEADYWRRRYYRTTFWLCCYDSDDDCDNNNSDNNCGKVIGAILLPIAIVVVSVISIILIVMLSLKMSNAFGKAVKRGVFTAMSASLSIMMIIGANTGLTASFHSLEIYYVIAIGVGLGIIFSILLIVSQTLSIKQSKLSISSNLIVWKDRNTRGQIILQNVESYEFKIDESEKEFTGDILEYAVFYLRDGTSKKIIINCWKIDDDTPIYPNDVKAIIAHYLQPIIENRRQKIVAESAIITRDQPTEPAIRKVGSYTIDDIDVIRNLIGDDKKVSVQWLSTVTQLPPENIEEIVISELDKEIQDGFVIDKTSRSLTSITINDRDIEKVRSLIGDRKKMSVKWISTVTNLPVYVVEEIAVKYLERKVHNGFVIS
ncbi:MAG: hypothetical protein FK734_04180 [Asgard group archaeon]|nr:hypothetical protein [Asgard group archaeon]